MGFPRRLLLPVLALASTISQTLAQTYSKCNPLTEGGCPPDPALGRSIDLSFTSSSSDFTAAGNVEYGSNGAQFTVAESGDSPTITSNWYIMFGHVEYTIKAAPGTGIVSSAVMQSDCLDEIDLEWLGGDDSQVQSNYFGKGITTTYNRGAFNPAPNNHDEFHTYTVDWTAEQIVWQVDGQTVRVLSQSDAASGQYPQTPMQVKIGAWAGGAPSNPPGTIAWAGGQCDFSQGPFTMYLKELKVTDYSTGTSYTYAGSAGTWQSINSSGGQINNGGSGSDTPTNTASAPAVTSQVSNGAPLAFGNGGSSPEAGPTNTYPWYGSATASLVTSVPQTCTNLPYGIPSGWTVGSDCKVSPPNSGAPTPPSTLSPPVSSPAASSSLASGLEVSTSWDSRGFPTLVTINPAIPTSPQSFNSLGFPITSSSAPVAPSSPTATSSASQTNPVLTSSTLSASGGPSSTNAPSSSGAAGTSNSVSVGTSPSTSNPTVSGTNTGASNTNSRSTRVSSSILGAGTRTTSSLTMSTRHSATQSESNSASATATPTGTPAAVNIGIRHEVSMVAWVAIGALLAWH